MIDQHKLARQEIGITNWKNNKGIGTLEWCTGMGKTFAAALIMLRMLKVNPKRTFIIVVPKRNLKDQWEDELKKFGVKNFEVFVINTVVLSQKRRQCSLLVLDELHRYGGDLEYASPTEFVRVFDYISYEFVLGLTATKNRLDGLHEILDEKCPVVDTILTEKAAQNGWISQFIEFNLKLQLTAKDRHDYDKINEKFNKLFAWFGYDFDTAMGCMSEKDRVIKGKQFMGALTYAKMIAPDNATDEELRRISKQAVVNSLEWNRLMGKRKTFLYDAQTKLDAVLTLVRATNLKTIVFGESATFASKVRQELGNIAVEYHSYLKTEIRQVKKGNKIVPVKFGLIRLQREALAKLKDNRTKVRVACAAKALDEGLDQDDIELGIITSYTSNPGQRVQRRGRIVRLLKKVGATKTAFIVNFYIENTQEEKWLKKAQEKGNSNVKWVNSVEEIIRQINVIV